MQPARAARRNFGQSPKEKRHPLAAEIDGALRGLDNSVAKRGEAAAWEAERLAAERLAATVAARTVSDGRPRNQPGWLMSNTSTAESRPFNKPGVLKPAMVTQSQIMRALAPDRSFGGPKFVTIGMNKTVLQDFGETRCLDENKYMPERMRGAAGEKARARRGGPGVDVRGNHPMVWEPDLPEACPVWKASAAPPGLFSYVKPMDPDPSPSTFLNGAPRFLQPTRNFTPGSQANPAYFESGALGGTATRKDWAGSTMGNSLAKSGRIG